MEQRQPGEELKEKLEVIVALRPGSAADRAIRFRLPEIKYDGTVLDTIQYGITETNLPRTQERTARSVEGEMNGQYGITVNGAAVQGTSKVRDYFQQAVKEGQKFLSVDIIVASKQMGGSSTLRY